MIIDVHTHFHATALAGAAGPLGPTLMADGGRTVWKIGERLQNAPKSIYDVDERLRMMDGAGVDVHVLGNSPKWYLYNHIHEVSPEICVAFARRQNQTLAEVVKAHPQRFWGLATLPLADFGASLDALDYAMGELGLHGVIVDSVAQGRGLDNPALFPIYQKLEAYGRPLFIHPGFLPDPRINQFGLRWMIGFCFDETYAMACLVFGGVLDRFPRLKVAITHGGGAMPFVIGRLTDGPKHRKTPDIQSDYPFDHYLRRFYFDACTYSLPALQYLASIVGVDRVVFGTNFPGSPELHPRLFDEWTTLSGVQRQQMLSTNAQALFGLTVAD